MLKVILINVEFEVAFMIHEVVVVVWYEAIMLY